MPDLTPQAFVEKWEMNMLSAEPGQMILCEDPHHLPTAPLAVYLVQKLASPSPTLYEHP